MPANTLFRLDFPEGWEDTTVFTYKGPFDSGVQNNNKTGSADPYTVSGQGW